MKRKRQLIHPDTLVLIKQILIGVSIFALLALVITGIWYGSRVEALTVSSVTVIGGETISHQEVEDAVWQELSGTYLRLIPKTFVYTYPHEAILASLVSIERIKDVSVKRTDTKELTVTFTEYVAEALWCEDDTETCMFLDETGYAFSVTPKLEGGAFIRFGTPGRSLEKGVEITTLENYETAKELVALLDEKGWYVERIDIDTASDAYIILTEGGELKVSLLEPADETIANLETVLSSEKFTELMPGNFKYIDLRFGNKVFVNNTVEEIPTEETSITSEFAVATSTPSQDFEIEEETSILMMTSTTTE